MIKFFITISSLFLVHSEVNHIAFPKDATCSTSQNYYFDISGLQCKLCDSTIARNSTPEYNDDDYIISSISQQNKKKTENALQCACPKNTLKVINKCTLRELQSGTCKSFECSSSSSDTCHKSKKDISLNGKNCVSCASLSSSSDNINNAVFYDELKKECSCNNPKQSISTGKPVLTRKLVELYNYNDDNQEEQQQPINTICTVCPYGSAVLSKDLYEEDEEDSLLNYYTTAGRKYISDLYTCSYCPDKDNMFFDTDYNCVCKSGYTIVGEFSIGEQSCINRVPTISSQYTQAEFRFLKNNANAGGRSSGSDLLQASVDSIIYSHYYLKVASKCEYLESISIVDSLSSCQTLGNLCVLNLYDESSSSCRQFQSIISEDRVYSSYHRQEDWKYSLPWLYYLDEANHIITDRGIQMRMSFSSSEQLQGGYTNRLKFKLAKYALDGMFLGLEDLSNQFFYCDDSSSRSINDIDTRFGTSERFEWKCDLNTLINEEMFFYDMYIVDEGDDNTSCGSSQSTTNSEAIGDEVECLYPIPVLNRNFIQGLSTPNMNNRVKEDQFDDRYTRRFFLFDNVSGRSAMNGHEILRYAKTIVLQTMIQTEDPSKIYPPRLIIEYAEVFVNSIMESSSSDSIIFKIEYTMDTKKFWSAVKIIAGFVSAVAALVWILRVNNWLSRNNRPIDDYIRNSNSSDPEYYGDSGRILFMNLVHFIMLACHSFVIVFTPFIIGLCTYWFLFFKLQKEVFLMLPPMSDEFLHNEYNETGANDEYWFYKFFFHALFWSQTAYIVYTIFRQSRIHVFFIDWEKPSSSSSSSSSTFDSLQQQKDGNYNGNSVSTWRSVLIANKWNEMQVMRKTCVEFTLLCIVFFFIGLKLYNNSISQPNLNRTTTDPDGSYSNCVLRFANNFWYWIILSLSQFIWNFIFYERYWKEPPSQSFIDVCTLAKVSVFILDEPYHGYYLHCRSPYEHADCSMAELIKQLHKEESGLTTDRGLDIPGAPEDCQVFEIFTSRIFHEQVFKIYDSFLLDTAATAANTIESSRLNLLQRARSSFLIPRNKNTDTNFKTIENVYDDMNQFLQNFIDQSPTPINNGLRYVIRQPTFLEKFLQRAPFDIRVKNHKCIFYPNHKNNNKSSNNNNNHINNIAASWIKDYDFLNVLFLGIELDLLLHDILMYNICDLIFEDAAISALLTYGMCLIRNFIRSWLGCRNIANKACIDPRFFF